MKKDNQQSEKLLIRISDGDWVAFAQFYTLYYPHIFRFAYYFLKDRESCGEVVADVFCAIWQSRKKLKDVKNIKTYLYVTTQHEVNRFLQARSRHYHVSIDEIPIHLEEKGTISPEEHLISLEMDELLTRTINDLPDKCRQIFLLSRQEGMKNKEIAEALSIQESTVRVQLKIAIDKIVDSLKIKFPELFLWILLFFL